MSAITRTALDGLGQQVADRGITAATPEELEAPALLGGATGVSPVVCEVLVDPAESEAARTRAFSRIACAVSGRVRSEHDLAA